jgi:putative transposase
MNFLRGGIYHIYNQGNNRQPIFFNHDNYLYFLQKLRTHVSPYCNILAWCLMPNHFHLMVEVEVEVLPLPPSRSAIASGSEGFTQTPLPPSRSAIAPGSEGFTRTPLPPSRSATWSRTPTIPTPPKEKLISFNHSIGIMLASYTRAINIQNNSSGSLFRQKTKSICLNEPNNQLADWVTSLGITIMHIEIPENQYPQVCFNYIHNNPVKAGLVAKPEAWEFSSFADLNNLRNGHLVNRERIEALGLIL